MKAMAIRRAALDPELDSAALFTADGETLQHASARPSMFIPFNTKIIQLTFILFNSST
jgi:hypothetical protein